MSDRFKTMQNLVNMNPVQQFAKKAVQDDAKPLSNAFSVTGMAAGMGQELGGNIDTTHTSSVKRHRLFLNMMKFNMQQGG